MSEQPAVSPGPDPAGAAREEGARQAVQIAAMVIAIPLLAWLERTASSPDGRRLLMMRLAKLAEKVSARVADRSWKLAERARVAYEGERDAP